MKRLGQQNLLRQMLGIERTEPVQLLDHLRGDPLRLAILRPAMHHAMSHGGQCIALARSSIQSMRTPTAAVWSGAVTGREKLSAGFEPFTCKVASGRPMRSIAPSRIRSERVTGLEQRELDAR